MRRFVGGLMCALLAFGFAAGRAASAENAPGGAGVEMVIEPPSPEYEAEKAKKDAEQAAQDKKSKGKSAKSKAKAADTKDPAAELEDAKKTFGDFCASWVDKLRERERYNQTKIQWEPSPEGGVVGEYVGYDTKNVGPTSGTETVEHVDATPIGKLVYLELKLRRAGKSKEEALTHEPEIVEKTEVTEIFRFDRGSWVY